MAGRRGCGVRMGAVLRRLALPALAAVSLLAAVSCGGPEPGPLGEVTVDPDQPIYIRTMLSFTGASSLGASLHGGVELAVRDFSSISPIKGRPVVLGDPIDSMCSEDGGRAAARVAAADERLVGVIGTSCSVAAVAAAPIISEAGLVMIAPSNTSPSLTSDLAGNVAPDHHEGYYRTSNNDLIQARTVAHFVYDHLDLRRMAVVHDGDPYTSGMATAFSSAFRDLGGEMAVTAVVSKGDTDMGSVLGELSAGEPDGIFLPIFRPEGTAIIQQAGQFEGLDGVTMIGGGALLVSEFLRVPESEGMYFSGPDLEIGANFSEVTGKTGDDVLAAYIAEYGGPPESPYWATAYDATTLLLVAIRQVVVEQGEDALVSALYRNSGRLHIDRARLRDEMLGNVEFHGITGTISCDRFGDCGTGNVTIVHHTDSTVTDISQLPIAYTR